MYNLSLNRISNHINGYNLSNLPDGSCHLLACVINNSSVPSNSYNSDCSNSDCFNCELIEFECNSSFCDYDGDVNNQPSTASM